MVKARIVLIIFLFNSAPVIAQYSQQDTLYKGGMKIFAKYATDNSYDVRLLDAELKRNNNDLKLGRSIIYPEIKAFADYHWFWGDIPNYIFPPEEGSVFSNNQTGGFYPVPLGLSNNLLMGLRLKQRIYDHRMFIANEGNEVYSEIEMLQKKQNNEEIIYQTGIAYFELLQLKTNLAIIDFNLGRMAKFQSIISVRLKNEMADSLELRRILLEKEELKLKKDQLLAGINSKTRYFKMIVGLDPESSIEIVPDHSDTTFIEGLQTYDQEALSTRQKLLEGKLKANNIKSQATKADYYPTLNFEANLLWQFQSPDINMFSDNAFNNNISTLGLALDIPIVNGMQKKIKLEQIDIDNTITSLQKEKLIHAENLLLEQASSKLDQLIERYEQQQKMVDYTRDFMILMDKKYQQGISNIRDLLEANNEYIEEKSEMNNLFYQVKIAEVNYLKAVGNLEMLLN